MAPGEDMTQSTPLKSEIDEEDEPQRQVPLDAEVEQPGEEDSTATITPSAVQANPQACSSSTPPKYDRLKQSNKAVIQGDSPVDVYAGEPAAAAAAGWSADAKELRATSELHHSKCPSPGAASVIALGADDSSGQATGEPKAPGGSASQPRMPNGKCLARRSAPGNSSRAPRALPAQSRLGPPTVSAIAQSSPARPMPMSLARSSAPPNLTRPSATPSLPLSASSMVIQSVRHVELVPRRAVRAAVVVSWNALIMAVAEIIIEILIVAGIYPKLPFRLDFFFLTLLSALLGYHTLHGVRQGHFDTSRNALQVGALVESALIAGDIKFMVNQAATYSASVPTRMPFLLLTAVNLVLVLYLYVEMYRFHKREVAAEMQADIREEEVGIV
mmetsp:Transcript_9938/g.28487  ORF Transcript_9938/g.28487 Transcript_9938/m.28487 type:complete len:387 (+) Transcript_9938:190-1350(+)|eukprot:CAMPEP_0117657600 /NCGR_PEP_ID=MMETSP0804-20121206/5418_1 /TAXON_ID=1074897 /ORGANISM="Tetraselmis astigmatica, Strain CCMP880" /LENGTH=386 /DNA_ID=CAMNT_0005464067 /DNA_START=113 /DNA_END=1273 /DNA_ORIENTATION=+